MSADNLESLTPAQLGGPSVKMLRLYSFNGMMSGLGSARTRHAGIWETIAASDLDTANPIWTLRLVVVWEGCQPLGTLWKIPQDAFPLLNAHEVSRDALTGTPLIRAARAQKASTA